MFLDGNHTNSNGDMAACYSQQPTTGSCSQRRDEDGNQSLSDPFKKMCLASQQALNCTNHGAKTMSQRVPLFHEDGENMPLASQVSFAAVSQQQAGVVLMSQDFVTPADQFDVGGDAMTQKAAGTLVRQRSPAAMSPTRIKRVNRNPSPSYLDQRHVVNQVRPQKAAPCYRSAFSENGDEEQTLMGWGAAGIGVPTSSGSRYRDDFKETGMLGQGAFCKVYSARHKLDGKVYAIKRTLRGVTRQSPEFAQFLQEVQILSNVPYHPGIIRYYSSWTEATEQYETEKLFIQLEAGSSTIKNLSLGDPLPEHTLIQIAQHVLGALSHLHMHGIAHMDIKPSNIIIVRSEEDRDHLEFKPGEIKLADFGLATRCRKLKGCATQEMSVQEGDACYLPLEVMNSDYSQLNKADIFALGATLFELASGNELPSGGQMYEDLRRDKVPLLPSITTSFMHMIRLMLKYDPKERPSADKLLSMPLLSR